MILQGYTTVGLKSSPTLAHRANCRAMNSNDMNIKNFIYISEQLSRFKSCAILQKSRSSLTHRVVKSHLGKLPNLHVLPFSHPEPFKRSFHIVTLESPKSCRNASSTFRPLGRRHAFLASAPLRNHEDAVFGKSSAFPVGQSILCSTTPQLRHNPVSVLLTPLLWL